MKWMTFKEFSEAVLSYCNIDDAMDTADFDAKIRAAYDAYIEADTKEREAAVQNDVFNKALIKEGPQFPIACPACSGMLNLAKTPKNPNGYQSAFVCNLCDLILYSQWTVQQWIDFMEEEIRTSKVKEPEV